MIIIERVDCTERTTGSVEVLKALSIIASQTSFKGRMLILWRIIGPCVTTGWFPETFGYGE